MDGRREGEGEEEAMEWELLHNNNNDDEGVDELGPQLDSCALIRPDYFSLHPPPTATATAVVSSNSSSSSTDPNEVDRNFDDSYLADQLFPYLHQQGPQFSSSSSSSSSAASSNNPPLSNDSDSDSDSKAILLPQTTSASTAAGGGALDSKEEGEEHEGDKDVMKEEEERRVVWWKVPLEVFRYWVLRVTPAAAAAVPAWSLSVAAAAAFLGILFLGRRLYKMKRKTQTLKLNLALDDKKVSQLMGRVARLNEAFSVVRRVPVVRPSLPAPSVTLRPVMSIR